MARPAQLVAIITTIGCLIVTALSRGAGAGGGATFDQLLVSPLTPAYIMGRKAGCRGCSSPVVQGSFIARVAAAWGYGVPFTGIGAPAP